MALGQAEVDRYLTSEKVLKGRPSGVGIMVWEEAGDMRKLRAPVEVDSVAVGELFMAVVVPLRRSWQFKLMLKGEEVRAWHINPHPVNHSNRGCPHGFRSKVRDPEHEHFWVDGIRGLRCAKKLKGVRDLTHQETFEKFCARLKILCQVEYRDPAEPGEQLVLRVGV